MENRKLLTIIIIFFIFLGIYIMEVIKSQEKDKPLEDLISSSLSFNIDYGESKIFLDTNLDDTLFTLESRIILYDGQEVYLTSEMPLEHTFSKGQLFQNDSRKITFIFFGGSNKFINFRGDDFSMSMNVVDTEDIEVIKLFQESEYQIIDLSQVKDYLGKPYRFIGITIYEVAGEKVILEYPIKTINYLHKGNIFQSDTGKIIFLNPITERIEIGYIIASSYNNTEIRLSYGNKEIHKIEAENYVGVREI